MTQEQIHQLFRHGYNQTKWRNFLAETFQKARLLSNPEKLIGIDGNVASKVLKLGHIVINEAGIERQIVAYEVTLAKGIILERNRVGLRNLLRKYWKDIDAAFIVYHNPENNKWRFTYVSELTGYDADGEFIKVKTEPKRYTYVLGEGESSRTAAERFHFLTRKAEKATLDDVKDAFSVEKLSKAFFDEYKNHYDTFCEYMVKKPNIRQTIFNGDEKAIRDFTKKLLGRIVFLYFIQKKGWMGVPVNGKWGEGNFDFLTNLFNQHRNPDLFYAETLSKLFFDTLNTKRKEDIVELTKGQAYRIPYLNGGLFEEDDKKHRNIVLSAKLFDDLFKFLNQYNFTIYEDDPNDHTVAVDPEMLGHIFENLLEDNKDKGTFYTPKKVVHYMCQETLIEYLTTWFQNKGYEVTGFVGFDKPKQPRLFSVNEGRKGQMVIETSSKNSAKRIDRSLIEKLLAKKLSDTDKTLVKQHANEFHRALDSVKIADPAIGSGAFPMGLLQEIFSSKQTLYHFEHGNLIGFPASEVKLNIIQNSIYGVDIEKGAVDIARLRFWLSLVVDEEEPKALPNLDYKIVVGNSLVCKLGNDVIDIDWKLKGGEGFQSNIFGTGELQANKGKLLKQISHKQKEFFNPNSDKKQLSADIRKLKIDLIINQLELMVATKGLENKPTTSGKQAAKQVELYLQTIGWKGSIRHLKKLKEQPNKPFHFFDWRLDFPEVMNEQVAEKIGFDIVIGNPPYVDIKNLPKEDVTIYFNHFSTTENRINLYAIFIELGYSLLKKDGVQCFINPNSMLMNESYKKTRKLLVGGIDRVIKLPDSIFETAIVETIIFFTKRASDRKTILTKFYANNDSVDFSGIKFDPVERSLWLSDSESRFNIFSNPKVDQILQKMEIDSTELKDYVETSLGITPYDKYKGHSEELIKNREYHSSTKKNKHYVPLISGKDIQQYRIDESNVDEYLKYGDWLGAPRDQRFFIEPKIVVRQIVGGRELRIIAGYSESPTYFTQIGFSLISKTGNKAELKYVLGLLNSQLISFYHKYKYLDPEKVLFQKILIANCKKLPIKNISAHSKKTFVAIVDKILKQKSEGKDSSALKNQIDVMAYRMYGLTFEEVKTVDPNFSLKKSEFEGIKI